MRMCETYILCDTLILDDVHKSFYLRLLLNLNSYFNSAKIIFIFIFL